jgi:signal transduction histidine kinase
LKTAIEIVGWVELVAYAALVPAALVQWRAHRGHQALWAALAFGALGTVFIAGRLLPENPDGGAAEWGVKALVAVLVLFPYFLYRFAASFEPRPFGWLDALAAGLTVAIVAWAFALPEIPASNEDPTTAFQLFIVGLLVQWVVLSAYVVWKLWRAGTGQPRVARWRMRLLSLAAAGLALALVVSGAAGSDDESAVALGVGLVVLGSAGAFYLGLNPPQFLRLLWRRPEEERLRAAITELVAAATEEDVKERVMPLMAGLVGARAVTMVDEDWKVVAEHGVENDEHAEQATAAEDAVRLGLPSGSLLVRASRYAPFFGGDELARLQTLGSLTLLALDRSRLFAQEREARQALERAAELQNRFIALASHELRTPAATVYGTAATLFLRADSLPDEQQTALRRVLFEQAERLRALVEQLLDLSRLEAAAIEIRPQPLPVHRRVTEITEIATADQSAPIRLDVPSDLVARVDPAAFDRIVGNLVANAIRYGEPPISVSAEQNDRHFRLAVEDSGPGVPAEFIPHLFEAFTRSETSRATDTAGTGLGLAIARSYAHAHGGELLYDAASLRGARFVLVIPNAQGENSAGEG